MIEEIIYRYDSYSDKSFKAIFGQNKDADVYKACCSLYFYVASQRPFSKLPSKEEAILSNIQEAIVKGNALLGGVALKQLCEEIKLRETQLEKQSQINRISIVISIVGVILSLFFGVLSVFKV